MVPQIAWQLAVLFMSQEKLLLITNQGFLYIPVCLNRQNNMGLTLSFWANIPNIIQLFVVVFHNLIWDFSLKYQYRIAPDILESLFNLGLYYVL